MNPTEASAHPLDRAKHDVAGRPAVAIETVLRTLGNTPENRSEEETAELLDVMAEAVIVASRSTVPPDEDPLSAMLADRKCDRMACAALLRLLVFDDEPFSTDRRLRGSTALFNRVLATSLYRDAGIELKHQAFEKRDKLRTLVSTHERDLIGHAKSLQSLAAIDSFRGRFRRLFGTDATRVFISPFLPDGFTGQTFEELFGIAGKVAGCTDVSVLGCAEEVESRCSELDEAASQLGTSYAKDLVLDLTETLRYLVRAQVSAAGFADPAHLSVSLRPKRYPCSEPQAPVTVRVDVANEGPGQAQDVVVEAESDRISFDEQTQAVGLLGRGTRQVQFHGLVVERDSAGESEALIGVKAFWRNPDRTKGECDVVQPLQEQPGEVPWEELAEEQPYQLEPVMDAKEFAGRAALVRGLAKVVLRLGSAQIQGERRVGKTSLAYAVEASIEERGLNEYVFIQLESGDFKANTAEATVARVGQLIAERVRRSDRRISGLGMPDFTPGLTTLTELFADVQDMAPEMKFVIVLDELDAMHDDLYKREPVGEAFFQTLRSLGSKKNIGFILIGGERMPWVTVAHGQALNKLKHFPLDYFPEDQMEDYAELVRAPVAGRLRFADDAIQALHEVSAGNPWMTKLLLAELFERQVERRDLDVQPDDVEDAVVHALPKFDASHFQHFWDDAIRGDVDDQELVSAMRRRVLLAFARCLEAEEGATKEAVVRQAAGFNVDEPTARETLQKFLDRGILRPAENGGLRCRVPLFERWLCEHGEQQIVLGAGDDDTLVKRQRSIEELRPAAEELDALAERWQAYDDKDVRPDRIAAWLGQFGGPGEQRIVMPLLEGFRFYTRRKVDEHLRELHQFVIRELASRGYGYTMSGKQRYRDDLLVCGLEGCGNTPTHLVKRYRDENGIYADRAVGSSDVRRVLDGAGQDIRAVLLLDDFIGTGNTAAARLKELKKEWTADSPWPRDVDVFLLAASGFDKGIAKVERSLSRLEWPVTVRAQDTLEGEDRCFGEDSAFFDSEEAREQARELCTRYGRELVPDNPLGSGGTEAAVCFEHRCPSGTLPVFWAAGESWEPLFPSSKLA